VVELAKKMLRKGIPLPPKSGSSPTLSPSGSGGGGRRSSSISPKSPISPMVKEERQNSDANQRLQHKFDMLRGQVNTMMQEHGGQAQIETRAPQHPAPVVRSRYAELKCCCSCGCSCSKLARMR